MSFTTWGVIFLLIAVTALYVAAEFGAVSARRSRVQQRAEEGNALAKRLMPFLSDAHALDRYIAACQVGITLSSLVLGAFGQATLTDALVPLLQDLGGLRYVAAHSLAATIVLIALTALSMILGELVPKSVALQYPTQTAMWTVIPMQWSLRLLWGFIVVLNGSGILILRLLGVKLVGHREIHSPEEIELLIAESREGGLLNSDAHKRLTHALQLGLRPVRDLMVPRTRIEAIDVSAQLKDAMATALASPFTRIPVFEESIDRIIGLIHVRDLSLLSLGAGRAMTVRDLVRPILIVPDSTKADRVLARMREERRQMAVVADEFGGTAGLVTVGDILDELFGHVADEFKESDTQPDRLPDGKVRLPGDLRLDVAATWTGVSWGGTAHTVAGRVLEALGHLPEPGESVAIDGVEVQVERVEHGAISSVLITPVVETEKEQSVDG